MFDTQKEYVAADVLDQVTVASKGMEKLKDSAFVKLVCPVGKYWDDKDRTNKTKRKRNTVTLKDNAQKVDG